MDLAHAGALAHHPSGVGGQPFGEAAVLFVQPLHLPDAGERSRGDPAEGGQDLQVALVERRSGRLLCQGIDVEQAETAAEVGDGSGEQGADAGRLQALGVGEVTGQQHVAGEQGDAVEGLTDDGARDREEVGAAPAVEREGVRDFGSAAVGEEQGGAIAGDGAQDQLEESPGKPGGRAGRL